LAQVGGEYQVDPIADLRPVCPNCHAMLHSRRPTPLSIAELKRIIDGNGRNTNAVDSSAT
jgi:5-methylcytosine-specific restriction protein A